LASPKSSPKERTLKKGEVQVLSFGEDLGEAKKNPPDFTSGGLNILSS
jgi:hypothetical protein